MNNRNEWKAKLLAEFTKKYGDISQEDSKRIDELLNQHWELSQQYGAEQLKRLTGLLGIGVGSVVDLSAILTSPATAMFGRALAMMIGYVGGEYAGAKLFPHVLPDNLLTSGKFDEQHLPKFFEKNKTVSDLIKGLTGINADIRQTLDQGEVRSRLGAFSVFAGATLPISILPDPMNQASQASRASMATVVIASAIAERQVPVQTMWQRDLTPQHRSQTMIKRRRPGRGGVE